MIQGGDQLEQEWVAKVFMAKVLKMNSVVNCSTFAELYLWQIQVQTQTEANSLLYNTNVPANMLGQLEGAGFPSEIIEAYKGGGTPWLDFRHTVFGHVLEGMDTVDEIANVQRGPQDRPVHDVVIETIEISE